MTIQTYDDIAEWYDAWVGTADVVEDPLFEPVIELLGDVVDARICDLACGQGRVTRYLSGRGARVVGVDLSANLLAIAAKHESDAASGATYLLDDAQQLAAIRDASVDGVLCHMALMDIPNLEASVRAAVRVLRPSGWLVFSVLHPCFNPAPSSEQVGPDGTLQRVVSGYFVEGFWRSDARPGPPGKVGAYHRTLSSYLNALIDAGLVIECLREPRATGDLAVRRPIWREVPAVLAGRCRKLA